MPVYDGLNREEDNLEFDKYTLNNQVFANL